MADFTLGGHFQGVLWFAKEPLKASKDDVSIWEINFKLVGHFQLCCDSLRNLSRRGEHVGNEKSASPPHDRTPPHSPLHTFMLVYATSLDSTKYDMIHMNAKHISAFKL